MVAVGTAGVSAADSAGSVASFAVPAFNRALVVGATEAVSSCCEGGDSGDCISAAGVPGTGMIGTATGTAAEARIGVVAVSTCVVSSPVPSLD